MRKEVSITKLTILGLVVSALCIAAPPAQADVLTKVAVQETCSGYTISVAGKLHRHERNDRKEEDEGKAKKLSVKISFEIVLTPTSSSTTSTSKPITVEDTITVTPGKDGEFAATATQTWAHYGVQLNSAYSLSGKAELKMHESDYEDCDDTVRIKFSPSTLSCTVMGNACLPTSSLSVLAQASTVTSYVPNGAWAAGAAGLQVVPLEPAGTPGSISTPGVVNSCSSNWTTGKTVCTSNGTDVYLITGSTLNTTLTSGANTLAHFSGGSCENCGVAVNAAANKAVIMIGLSTAPSGSGLQFLDLATNTFATPVPASSEVSEDVLWDQTRNLILSPGEGGVYDLFQVSPTTTAEFGNTVGGLLDSAAEDCSTGVALSTIEETDQLYIGDLTQASYSAGPPATWTTAQKVQTFPEFAGFTAGTSGIAVAPGQHLGIVAGEFGGNQFGAIQLPSTSGTGTPSLVDYTATALPNTPDGNAWSQGFDPHTVTAYVSPNNNKAYGVMANAAPPTYLAVIDLQALLAAPRLTGTHTVDPTYNLVANGVVRYVATH